MGSLVWLFDGASLFGALALASIHLHLGALGRRVERLEHLPTAAREAREVHHA